MPINSKKAAVRLDKMCSEHDYDEYKYVGNLLSTYRSKEIIDKSIFGKPTIYQFENLDVCGPEKYDMYLTHLFNDWRQLPPEDKRCSAHDFIFVDFDTPYKR